MKNARAPGRIPILRKRGTLLIDGLTLTVVGMLTVFAFLIILVLAMVLLQRVVERLGPAASRGRSDLRAVTGASPERGSSIAAAAAAIHAYRSRKETSPP